MHAYSDLLASAASRAAGALTAALLLLAVWVSTGAYPVPGEWLPRASVAALGAALVWWTWPARGRRATRSFMTVGGLLVLLHGPPHLTSALLVVLYGLIMCWLTDQLGSGESWLWRASVAGLVSILVIELGRDELFSTAFARARAALASDGSSALWARCIPSLDRGAIMAPLAGVVSLMLPYSRRELRRLGWAWLTIALGVYGTFGQSGSVDVNTAVALVALLAFALTSGPPTVRPHLATERGRRLLLGAAGAGLLLGTVGSGTVDPAGRPTEEVAFLASEHCQVGDPATYPGGFAGPVFGAWRRVFDRLGRRSRELSHPIDENQLDSLSTLIMINYPANLTPLETQAVHSWVRRGGVIVVLGDHTDAFGQLRGMNALLAPYGIQMNSDSAVPPMSDGGWSGSLISSKSNFGTSVLRLAERSWRIGCTIEATRHATPLLVAARGFADAASTADADGGGIGDMVKGVGEHEGGLILAAYARSGAGGVVVFGDTSSFQDVPVTLHRDEIEACTAVLLNWTQAAATARCWETTALLLAAAALVHATLRREHRRPSGWTAVILLSMVAAIERRSGGGVADGRLPPGEKMVVLDASHGNVLQAIRGAGDGCATLIHALVREGFDAVMGVAPFRCGGDRKADAVAIYRPRRSFSDAELRELEEYLRGGGRALLIGGYDTYLACPELYRYFGITMSRIPLGPGRLVDTSDGGEVLTECWPLQCAEGSTVGEAHGYPVAVRLARGHGVLVVVSDEYPSVPGLGGDYVGAIEGARQVLQLLGCASGDGE